MSVRFKWPPDLAAFRFGSALIWALRDGGISASITGISPLSLVNAIAKPITKLLQHGKVAVSGSTLTCNNGELVAVDDELPIGYKRITSIKFDGDFWYDTNEILTGNDNVTMTLANTSSSGQNVFGSYNKTGTGVKNFSLYVYGGGSSSKSYFRYGEQLLRPQFGSGERTIIFGKDGTSGFLSDVTATPETFTTVATAYIGMLPNSSSAAYTGSIVGSILVGDRLKYIPCERVSDGFIGYYEMVNGVFLEPVGTGTPIKGDYDASHCTVVSVAGTPEEIVVSASGVEDQTAHAENLYAVGDIEDTQDIISGTVTRRTEAVVSDGTTPSGRYVGTVGEGNIIIKAREEGYTGDIVSFATEEETPLNGLIVSLSPQQDLHGYDSPWPAGGGVNKCDISNTTHSAYNIGNIPNTLQPSTAYTFSIKGTTTFNSRLYLGNSSDPTRGLVALNSNYLSAGDAEVFTTPADMTNYDILVIAGSGAGAGDVDPSVLKPMISIGSTAPASWSPYSNICPISGWTGCEVMRYGTNLIEISNDTNTYKGNGQYFTLTYGENIVTFTPTVAGSLTATWKAFVIKQEMVGQKITFSRTVTGGFCALVKSDTNDGEFNNSGTLLTNGEGTWTIDQAAVGRAIGIRWANTTGEVQTLSNVMLNFGDTAEPYEPYNGNSYSVTFGETVYGGSRDVVSGVKIVDRAIITPNVNSISAPNSYGIVNCHFTINNQGVRSGDPKIRLAISNVLSVQNTLFADTTNVGFMIANENDAYLRLKSSDISDVASANAWVANNSCRIVFYLGTPTETTITPTPITALKGYNAMWSNAGAVTAYVPAGDLIEQVTPQKLNTAEGDNTITVTAEVEDIVFDVIYRENNPDG